MLHSAQAAYYTAENPNPRCISTGDKTSWIPLHTVLMGEGFKPAWLIGEPASYDAMLASGKPPETGYVLFPCHSSSDQAEVPLHFQLELPSQPYG